MPRLEFGKTTCVTFASPSLAAVTGLQARFEQTYGPPPAQQEPRAAPDDEVRCFGSYPLPYRWCQTARLRVRQRRVYTARPPLRCLYRHPRSLQVQAATHDADADGDGERYGSLRDRNGLLLRLIGTLTRPTYVTARLDGTPDKSISDHFTRGRINNPARARMWLPNGDEVEAYISSC